MCEYNKQYVFESKDNLLEPFLSDIQGTNKKDKLIVEKAAKAVHAADGDDIIIANAQKIDGGEGDDLIVSLDGGFQKLYKGNSGNDTYIISDYISFNIHEKENRKIFIQDNENENNTLILSQCNASQPIHIEFGDKKIIAKTPNLIPIVEFEKGQIKTILSIVNQNGFTATEMYVYQNGEYIKENPTQNAQKIIDDVAEILELQSLIHMNKYQKNSALFRSNRSPFFDFLYQRADFNQDYGVFYDQSNLSRFFKQDHSAFIKEVKVKSLLSFLEVVIERYRHTYCKSDWSHSRFDKTTTAKYAISYVMSVLDILLNQVKLSEPDREKIHALVQSPAFLQTINNLKRQGELKYPYLYNILSGLKYNAHNMSDDSYMHMIKNVHPDIIMNLLDVMGNSHAANKIYIDILQHRSQEINTKYISVKKQIASQIDHMISPIFVNTDDGKLNLKTINKQIVMLTSWIENQAVSEESKILYHRLAVQMIVQKAKGYQFNFSQRAKSFINSNWIQNQTTSLNNHMVFSFCEDTNFYKIFKIYAEQKTLLYNQKSILIYQELFDQISKYYDNAHSYYLDTNGAKAIFNNITDLRLDILALLMMQGRVQESDFIHTYQDLKNTFGASSLTRLGGFFEALTAYYPKHVMTAKTIAEKWIKQYLKQEASYLSPAALSLMARRTVRMNLDNETHLLSMFFKDPKVLINYLFYMMPNSIELNEFIANKLDQYIEDYDQSHKNFIYLNLVQNVTDITIQNQIIQKLNQQEIFIYNVPHIKQNGDTCWFNAANMVRAQNDEGKNIAFKDKFGKFHMNYWLKNDPLNIKTIISDVSKHPEAFDLYMQYEYYEKNGFEKHNIKQRDVMTHGYNTDTGRFVSYTKGHHTNLAKDLKGLLKDKGPIIVGGLLSDTSYISSVDSLNVSLPHAITIIGYTGDNFIALDSALQDGYRVFHADQLQNRFHSYKIFTDKQFDQKNFSPLRSVNAMMKKRILPPLEMLKNNDIGM